MGGSETRCRRSVIPPKKPPSAQRRAADPGRARAPAQRTVPGERSAGARGIGFGAGPSALRAQRAVAAGARAAAPTRPGTAAGESPEAATPSARRSEALVYEAVLEALLGGRLRPGTALRERTLAAAFGATRGTVRKVLARLGHEGKLELHPNRGAFVPQPSAEDVRRVYEQRKVLECGIVALLAERLARERLAPLDAALERERRAHREGRRDEAVRLAGDFHLLLVDLFDNPELSRALRALVARTQLFVALFESAEAGACAVDEHDTIVRSLRRRDPTGAVRAMLGHLDHVEQRVLYRMPKLQDTDVGAILRAAMR